MLSLNFESVHWYCSCGHVCLDRLPDGTLGASACCTCSIWYQPLTIYFLKIFSQDSFVHSVHAVFTSVLYTTLFISKLGVIFSVMNAAIDEAELLTEVPPALKRLAKVVVRGFYECEHVALINILTNSIYPCVKEEDLSELLRFDKKQLRQVLMRLKSDKLIKQRIHKEKQPETGTTMTFNYYFINYKLFVNVVKYKLDHIRKKIESDEKQAKNRPSFLCPDCQSKYSDLEVDRLLDFETGKLKCTNCGGTVEEDISDIRQANNSRTSLARFNEQMEPVFRLLRECENLNLAPAILEPEPAPSQIAASMRQSGSGSVRQGWATSRTGGFEVPNEPGIEIRIGSEDKEDGEKDKRSMKETPVWMRESTVMSAPTETAATTDSKANSESKEAVPLQKDDGEILPDLLAYESAAKKPQLDVKAAFGEEVEDEESDTSEDSDSEFLVTPQPVSQDTKVTETIEEMIDSDQDDDEEEVHKVKVGSKMVALDDVTAEMLKSMTPEEHEAYTRACQQAYSHYY